MSETTNTTETFFERMYKASKEAVDLMKLPFVMKAAKRKVQAAYDSAAEQKIDAETKVNELCADVKNLNINEILKQKQIIKDAEVTATMVKELYKEFFDKDLKMED